MVDYFGIIVSEICEKQNGISLKRGDDTFLRDTFLRRGGDINRLSNGVLTEFDKLKGVIVDAYQAGRIATPSKALPINFGDVPQQLVAGRTAALKIAESVLGKDLLSALTSRNR